LDEVYSTPIQPPLYYARNKKKELLCRLLVRGKKKNVHTAQRAAARGEGWSCAGKDSPPAALDTPSTPRYRSPPCRVNRCAPPCEVWSWRHEGGRAGWRPSWRLPGASATARSCRW